ncbi:hamartin [Balamuthia mandrillaris]
MLLPNLLPFLPAALPQLFVILKRLLLWGIETEPRIDNSPSNDDSSIATTTTSSSSAFCSSSSEKQAERHSQQGRSLASRDNDYKYSGGTILEAPIPPPPPELGRALSVYFHHLYGMFPCNLVAFIRKQRHESYFQHRIRPLVTPLPLNPALLTSTKKGELTLERWKNKEPHSIVTQSMGEYYYQYKGKMDEFKRLHAHYPSDDSLKRALATSPVEKRKQQNNSIIDDEEEAEKQNDESIEEASKKDQAWLQEVEKVCNEIDAELSAAASIVNITDLNSIRTTDLTEERTEERESREGLKNKTKFTRHSFPVVGKRLNNKLSDSLFSNELGLKILQLQSLLERHLELGVAIDPWVGLTSLFLALFFSHLSFFLLIPNIAKQGETDGLQQHTQARQDGRRAATATTTTIASHVADPNQVMKEYLVLHNELLFERYLRQQFLRRLGTLQKDSIAILSAEAKYFAAANQVQTQYELLRQMHELLLQRQQEISLLKQSHRAQTEELLKKMNALFDENRNMSEELHALRLQVEYANDNLERSTLKLAEKTNAVLQLRTKVEDLSSRLRQQDDLQKRITALNEELILWDQLHQKKQREREREENEKEKENEMDGTSQHQPRRRKESLSGSYSERERTKQLLEQRGDLVTSLHEQLDQANDKYQHCQGQLFELRQRLAQLEKEKEERESLSTSQKQLLSYQQQVSIAKIKSIEGKYETIKKINLALENHILRLQTQLEILQQQLQQARRKISLSSLTSSSTTTTTTTIERTTEPEGGEEGEQTKGGGIVRKRNQRSRTWMSSPSLLGEVELLQNEDGEEEETEGGASLSSFTMERRSYAPSSTTTTTDSTRSNSLRSRSSLEEDEMRRRREESGLKTQRGAAQRE